MTVTSGKKRADAIQSVDAIRSDEDLADATRELCALMSSKTPLCGADEKRFQHLVNIIEEYEDVHYPIPEPSHAALLKHLLSAKNGGLNKLSNATSLSVADIKAILSGKRQVWPQEARAFAKYFAVDPSVFDPEPDTFTIMGIATYSGLAGAQSSGWFRVIGRAAATATNPKNGLPTSVTSIIRRVLAHQVGPGLLPLFGVKS
jgi:HTH-type transcriptional regulator/antitoxin HigA